MRFILVFILALVLCHAIGQTMAAEEILDKSIKYHDPNDYFHQRVISFELEEERPNGANRETNISIDISNKQFVAERQVDTTSTTIQFIDTAFHALLNGSPDFSDSARKEHRLDRERCTFLRDYYTYLWLMPMKLKDQGTIIDREAKMVDFFGEKLWEIRVTYAPEVGSDIWYFYFKPETFALSGYRFYHDEVQNDGEYILFEDEVEYEGLRIPKSRAWYTHKDAKYLGKDVLVSVNVRAYE